MTYTQQTLLAMELNRSHVGALVQIITESWSMTGTLTRVDQHDNREWEISYPGRQLVPSGGEIYTELWIGPWRGRVIGNQPVTVERVKGTLEAPERGPFYESNLKAIQEEIDTPLFPKDYADTGGAARATAPREGYYPDGVGEDPPEDVISGDVVEDLPSTIHDVHRPGPDPRWTLCGLRADTSGWVPDPLRTSVVDHQVTCRECKRRELPPAPDDWPDLPNQ